jgi:YD repeat-containing protein
MDFGQPFPLDLPRKVVTSGLTAEFQYDALGNLLRRTDTDTASGEKHTRTWSYERSDGTLSSIHGPRTDIAQLVRFTYDASGRLTGITNAVGQSIQIASRLPGGLPTSVVDQNGVRRDYQYNSRGWLLSITEATRHSPRTVKFLYDKAGNPVSIRFPDDSLVTFAYDAAHRLTRLENGEGEHADFTLDPLGDITQVSVAARGKEAVNLVTREFDKAGRLTRSIQGEGEPETFAYDQVGNILSVRDASGRLIHQQFDELHRLISLEDPLGGKSTFEYDPHGRLLGVTDARGNVTHYVYDGFGDLLKRLSPDAGATTYSYDEAGDLLQSVDANGVTVNRRYDALDRLIAIAVAGSPEDEITYRYDEQQSQFGIGRLTSVKDSLGLLTRGYDEEGNLVKENRLVNGREYSTKYDYDAGARVQAITYPSSLRVRFTRDLSGRVNGVFATPEIQHREQAVIQRLQYQPLGPPVAINYGNGVGQAWRFDSGYRAAEITLRGKNLLSEQTYDRLSLHRTEETLPRTVYSAVDPKLFGIIFATSPGQQIYINGLELLHGEIIVFRAKSEGHNRSSAACQWGSIGLTHEDVAAVGQTIIGRELIAAPFTRRIRPPPLLLSRLLKLHEAAGHLAKTAPDILAQPEVARALEQELVRAMVLCISGGETGRPAAPITATR